MLETLFVIEKLETKQNICGEANIWTMSAWLFTPGNFPVIKYTPE